MSNRLASETSPYLLQHADNPVDWRPWDAAALAEARGSGRPILLSIGYSSCHWCHVMAHESFEDPATAAVMNERFVNIKVDREERPDLDKVYQLAHQLMTQRPGGWPLTMFLDPETLAPFFAGTYFPKTPRHQLPGFIDLMLRIHQAFEKNREALSEQNQKLVSLMGRLNPEAPPQGAAMSDAKLLAAAPEQLRAQYDEQHGGFGHAPKFPMPITLERVLRHWACGDRSGQRLPRCQLLMGRRPNHLGSDLLQAVPDDVQEHGLAIAPGAMKDDVRGRSGLRLDCGLHGRHGLNFPVPARQVGRMGSGAGLEQVGRQDHGAMVALSERMPKDVRCPGAVG